MARDRFFRLGQSKRQERIRFRLTVALYLEDKRLVKQMLAGNRTAFDQFFDEHFSRLYRFTLARIPDDPDGAQEIVQSTMTKAIRRLKQYRAESMLHTWLCSICRNEISDWLKKTGRRRSHIVLTEDSARIRAIVESMQSTTTEQPESTASRHELRRLIQVALDQLPAKYGDALEWKYIEGYSVKEIAGRLKVGPEAAQSLLARAKRAFREVYLSLTEGLPPHSSKG